jgi:hypothetical protein
MASIRDTLANLVEQYKAGNTPMANLMRGDTEGAKQSVANALQQATQDPYSGLNVLGTTKLVGKTAQELAHATAQKNAAEMLGLHPENTAMERAKAMGFDTENLMYHGSPYNSITAFKPNVRGANFFTKDKDLAEQFTRYGPIHEEGATTYTTFVKPGKTFDPKTSQGKHELEYYTREKGGHEFRNRPQLSDATPNEIADYIANDSDNWHFLESEPFQRFLKNRDYNSFKVTEQGVENLATYNPKNVRSQFAAFDPARANEPDLLAGAMALPLGTDEDKRNKIIELLKNK